VPPAISSCSPRAFSPLDRFMGKADFERVVEEMRLASASEILTG
jgi:ATP sulfurylase